jgi:hypothetical protein
MTGASAPPPDGPWIDAWLSSARLSRYLRHSGGDRTRAVALYEWNAQVSAALQRDLAHVEVALRNAYDAAANAHWAGSGHWLLHDAATVFAPVPRTKHANRNGRRIKFTVDINQKPRELIERAVRDAGGPRATSGKVVAELSFGFWRYLSSSAHEKTLWVPMLHHAFPPATSRPDVDARIGRLHQVRNRIAHHESLLDEDLPDRLRDLLDLAGVLHSELALHLTATSVIPPLLRTRP